MTKDVRDSNNRVIGYLNDVGNVIMAMHMLKGYCGQYVKGSDTTFDKDGRRYCFGDGTVSLILNA